MGHPSLRRLVGFLTLSFHFQWILSQDCPLEIWVFDSLADCRSPQATATLYADNQCRTLDSHPDFPGNYIAKCDAGSLDFVVSGCSDDSCGNCVPQRNQQSHLYSRMEPIPVQEIQDLNGPARFECFSFTNGIVEVFYAIYGDCNAPGCSDPPPTTPRPVAPPPTGFPVPAPTLTPVRAPTRSPVRDPTRAPVPDPTQAPVRAPTGSPVRAPTGSPVRDPTRAPIRPTSAPIIDPTNAPVRTPITDRPTQFPSLLPTAAPMTASPTSQSPTRSPLEVGTTMYPTKSPVTESPTEEPMQRFSDTAKVEMLLFPMEQLLNETELERWKFVTSTRIRFATDILQARTSQVQQELIRDRGNQQQSLLITFDVTVVASDPGEMALSIYLETFDHEDKVDVYRTNLVSGAEGVAALANVEEIIVAKSRYPNNSTETTKSTAHPKFATILLVVGVATVGSLVIIGGFVFRSSRRRRANKTTEPTDSEPEITVEVEDCHPDPKLMLPGQDDAVQYTHDIELHPNDDDDISTLGGYTGIVTGTTVKDDATASVHEDYDYDNNMYRTSSNDQSFSNASTMFSSHTALERLGAMLFSDDKSLDQQFLDDRMNSNLQTRRKRIVPFEIQAPPGLLGMVVDTPISGGSPVVRALQPDSVLNGKIQIGDRLISVNYKDVTGLTAKDVSNLISFKQNEERLLKFVRVDEGA